MRSGRGWLAGDWPSMGGVLNITAAVWTAGFHWWRSGNKKRTQNVSEYMLVLALCQLNLLSFRVPGKAHRQIVDEIFSIWAFAYFIQALLSEVDMYTVSPGCNE